ncbi:hypothetical protein EYF80_006343 [Liparis tanakae]|uniref:Uncharacterized protein n=1 Tax=Liparis tanakae TaxID=230148 RepID=A0A4Z2J1H2_9TELE|nr:hypothetical protein EYF80_006343 [Liparis tanakae]
MRSDFRALEPRRPKRSGGKEFVYVAQWIQEGNRFTLNPAVPSLGGRLQTLDSGRLSFPRRRVSPVIDGDNRGNGSDGRERRRSVAIDRSGRQRVSESEVTSH